VKFSFSLSALACLVFATIGFSAPLWDEVSGAKALEHVQHLVDLGPRPPASDAIEKARAYIEEQLQKTGWKIGRQTFTDDTPRGKISFTNLIATFGSKPDPQFLLCSHYDTKTFETIRFVGANDGGSSTGLLIELGRVLAQDPKLASRVELVFFDGEEAYENFTDTDGLFGSRFFANALTNEKRKFRGGILFDMIGDKSLDVTLPPDSPPELARGIFASAEALKVRDHFTYFDRDILDDHSPINRAGTPVIDLIDFDFPPWHTADDTMDKISAESLQTVGRVAVHYLATQGLR
jgi:Zn-dependent M28 family amino/carboxypeptidase